MRRLELLPEAPNAPPPRPQGGGVARGPLPLRRPRTPHSLAQVPGTPRGFSQGGGHAERGPRAAGRGASPSQAGLSSVTVWGWCTDKRRHGIPEGRVTGNVELLTLQQNVAKPWNRVQEGLGCETVGHFRQLLLAVCLCPCVCLAGLCVYVFVRVSSSGPGKRGVIRRPTDFGGAAKHHSWQHRPTHRRENPRQRHKDPLSTGPARPGTPGALSGRESGGLLKAATALLRGASRLWVRKGTTCQDALAP